MWISYWTEGDNRGSQKDTDKENNGIWGASAS